MTGPQSPPGTASQASTTSTIAAPPTSSPSPTGSGKGAAAVIHTLLLSRQSIDVLDIKAEDYIITDPDRTRLSQTIITLNPSVVPSGIYRWLE